MPIWFKTNYIATGDAEELLKLSQTLNTMMGGLSNDFGPHWMGNLLYAFSMSLEEESQFHCRGIFNPNFLESDEKKSFTVEADGTVRFSTVSAWGRSQDIEKLIVQRFPSIEFSWCETDEFGEFSQTHNPGGFPELEAYAASN